MIVRHRLREAKRIEELPLVVFEPPHHRPPPPRIASGQRNHSSQKSPTTFATKSAMSGREQVQQPAWPKLRLTRSPRRRGRAVLAPHQCRLLAVLGLISSSNLVGACTGKSAVFSPLRMRST